MATKRTGLGRGIGALIPTSDGDDERPVDVFFGGDGGGTGLVAVPGARLANLSPDDIVPEPAAAAIRLPQGGARRARRVGPRVRRAAADRRAPAGRRRARASRSTSSSWASAGCARRSSPGLDSIPAVIKNTADEVMLRDALLENLHRADLNPLEEASAYQQLLADFGITQEKLAERIGRSRPQITNTIRLLQLPESIQRRVAAGVLTAGHARAILSVGTPDAMERLADKIVNEDLSVRAAEAVAGASTPSKAARQAAARPAAGSARRDRRTARRPARHPGQGRARIEQGDADDRVRERRAT